MIPIKNFRDCTWCTYKQSGSGVAKILIGEQSYSLQLEVYALSNDIVFFRLEDYKKATLGNKRRGERDCDLTFIEGQQVYQFDLKNVRDIRKAKKEAMQQCQSSDRYLVSILKQIDPNNSYDLNQFDSQHVMLHLRQKRESLVRGKQPLTIYRYEQKIIIIRVIIDNETHSGTASLREIIRLIEGFHYERCTTVYLPNRNFFVNRRAIAHAS